LKIAMRVNNRGLKKAGYVIKPRRLDRGSVLAFAV
jgi:hypothetical protein